MGLVRLDTTAVKGPFRRFRWVVVVLYGSVAVLGVVPEVARPLGMPPIQVAAIGLVLLIVLAHGLTWEFMMEPDEAVRKPEGGESHEPREA